MLRAPFFDPAKSYYENWEQGPFSDFADGVVLPAVPGRFSYLGRKISYPLGIAAGPLLNGKYVKAALDKGFDVPVYKTIRTREKKSNEWPNVLPVAVEGDLTLAQAAQGLTTKDDYTEPLAITNSFGNPSYASEIWQKDVRDLMLYANTREGQMVCGMIEGTKWDEGGDEEDFVADWVLAAKMMADCGVHAIEANFSCPNEGDRVKKLLCYDAEMGTKIASAIKNEVALPLVIKISFFESDAELKEVVEKVGPHVDGIAAINTIPAAVYKPDGSQALPGGPWRLKSGICGYPIKWAGLDMVKRLKQLRESTGLRYDIVGVGGVTVPKDFKEYRDAGADVVMTATGAMWNGYLAREIREQYPDA